MRRLLSVVFIICAVATLGTAQDWSLEPTFGSVELSSGFSPDPHTVDIVAGGGTDLSDMGYRGYIAEAPDFDLYYEAGGFPLAIRVQSNVDTVLLISDPDGNWHFNDDEVGLNPRIRFDNPPTGLYDIWVGVLDSSSTPEAQLIITELE